MKPLALRRLTSGEADLAREMFGAALKPERVRLLAAPVWPAAEAWRDFAQAPLQLQAVFVHELTHVWQAQHGRFLPWAKLRAGDSAGSYRYDLAAGPGFERLNIEQQAMVVQHAFLSARGQGAPHPPEIYARAAQQWRRG